VKKENGLYKITYCIPALYLAGGMERVLTLKANFLAEHFGYDITVILTDGKGKPNFYPLSPQIKIVNLDIGFEELWNTSFVKRTYLYLRKQRVYKKRLKAQLMELRPDITISLLRREINFINDIKDGSKKVGEIHINRVHYRNFEKHETNAIKQLFSKFWMQNLIGKLRKLDSFVVLTESDKNSWPELSNVQVIPNPLSFMPTTYSQFTNKQVIAVGRYCHEKGYDSLLQAWAVVQKACPEWRLDVYGDGDRSSYEQLIDQLGIDRGHCQLNGRVSDIEKRYTQSSVAVCSSRFEGFGMAIAEAMACGVPVVSFDCPWGPRSIITDKEDGILVENDNVEALAQALIGLLNNPKTIELLGKKARKNIQRFSIENIADKWKSLFERL